MKQVMVEYIAARIAHTFGPGSEDVANTIRVIWEAPEALAQALERLRDKELGV